MHVPCPWHMVHLLVRTTSTSWPMDLETWVVTSFSTRAAVSACLIFFEIPDPPHAEQTRTPCPLHARQWALLLSIWSTLAAYIYSTDNLVSK